ncbi:MAG: hypothetical protein J0L66_03235 [Cytophagales bacterium]|nr:hypothetical protein [Cytophagales bacterium]
MAGILGITFLLGISRLFSQSIADNVDTRLQNAINNARSKVVASQQGIFIGIEYMPYSAISNMPKKHPFFGSVNTVTGSIAYGTVEYRNITLLFDLVLNEVLIEGQQGQLISLVKQNINWFKIGDHKFIRCSNLETSTGLKFYEALVESDSLSLLCLRSKNLKGATSYMSRKRGQINFEVKNKYFLLKAGSLFPVQTKNDLERLLNRKDQVSTKTKSNSKEDKLISTAKNIFKTV